MNPKHSSQKEVFSVTEGDQWYHRNRTSLDKPENKIKDDQVLRCLESLQLEPAAVLEIGCSNGWRLDEIRKRYTARCHGLEPSSQAISEGRRLFPDIQLDKGTADLLPYENNIFDTVIIGFCLYLCDRNDLFKIAAEVDRVLSDGGYIIILDFHPPFPYRNRYVHHDGLYSYKMRHADMFAWNPVYTVVWEQVFSHSRNTIDNADDRLSVIALKKSSAGAYPDNPYER